MSNRSEVSVGFFLLICVGIVALSVISFSAMPMFTVVFDAVIVVSGFVLYYIVSN